MGQRAWLNLKPWQTRWPGDKVGRYWKRQLGKARRRRWKLEVKGKQEKRHSRAESECNWKTW